MPGAQGHVFILRRDLLSEEARELFEIIEGLKAQGKSIVFITHKLREVNLEVLPIGQVVQAGAGHLVTSGAG